MWKIDIKEQESVGRQFSILFPGSQTAWRIPFWGLSLERNYISIKLFLIIFFFVYSIWDQQSHIIYSVNDISIKLFLIIFFFVYSIWDQQSHIIYSVNDISINCKMQSHIYLNTFVYTSGWYLQSYFRAVCWCNSFHVHCLFFLFRLPP